MGGRHAMEEVVSGGEGGGDMSGMGCLFFFSFGVWLFWWCGVALVLDIVMVEVVFLKTCTFGRVYGISYIGLLVTK